MMTADLPVAITTNAVTADAKPSSFQFGINNSAVLVIDMQNDFGSEGGMFHRAGIDISAIQRAVEPTRVVIQAARANGLPIVYLKMAFKADLSDAGPIDSANYARHQRMDVGSAVQAPDGSESRILIRDTWNTEILAALAPKGNDIVMYKHRFSGFFETELDKVLKKLGVSNLIVTGCTTSFGLIPRLGTRCFETIGVSCWKTARPNRLVTNFHEAIMTLHFLQPKSYLGGQLLRPSSYRRLA
jgi:nicotinamidase-related amidase